MRHSSERFSPSTVVDFAYHARIEWISFERRLRARRKKIMMRLSLFIFILVTPHLFANATTMRTLNTAQKTARADRIVIASVEEVNYQKAVQGQRIYTLTTLKVLRTLKGKVLKDMHLVVRQIGGQIGEWSQHISGDAKFEKGQEVLVFLRHDPQDDLHFLVGMGQGKIDVDVGSDRLVKESSTPTHHHVLRLSPKTSLSKPPVALSALVDKILMLIATAPSMRNQLPSTSK
jgi:hypothetical protein